MNKPKGLDSSVDLLALKAQLVEKCREHLGELKSTCYTLSRHLKELSSAVKNEHTNSNFTLMYARDKNHSLADSLEQAMSKTDGTLRSITPLETATTRIVELCTQLSICPLDKDEYLSQDYFSSPEIFHSLVLTIKTYAQRIEALLGELKKNSCGEALEHTERVETCVERIEKNLKKATEEFTVPHQELKNIYSTVIPFLKVLESKENPPAPAPQPANPVQEDPESPFSFAKSLLPSVGPDVTNSDLPPSLASPPIFQTPDTNTDETWEPLSGEPKAPSADISPLPAAPFPPAKSAFPPAQPKSTALPKPLAPPPALLPSIVLDIKEKEALAILFRNNLIDLNNFLATEFIATLRHFNETLHLHRYNIQERNPLRDQIQGEILDTYINWLLPGTTHESLRKHIDTFFRLSFSFTKDTTYPLTDDSHLAHDLFRSPDQFNEWLKHFPKYHQAMVQLVRSLKPHEKQIADLLDITKPEDIQNVATTMKEIQQKLDVKPMDLSQMPDLERMFQEINSMLKDMREVEHVRNSPTPPKPKHAPDAPTLAGPDALTMADQNATSPASAPAASPSSSSPPQPLPDSNNGPISIEPDDPNAITSINALPAQNFKKLDASTQKRLEKAEKTFKENLTVLQGQLATALENTRELDSVLASFSDTLTAEVDRRKASTVPTPQALMDKYQEGLQTVLLCKVVMLGIGENLENALTIATSLQTKKIAIGDLQDSVLLSINKFTSKSHDLQGYINETEKILKIKKSSPILNAFLNRFSKAKAEASETKALYDTGEAIFDRHKLFNRLIGEFAYIESQLAIVDTHSTDAPISSPTMDSPTDKNLAKAQKKKVEQLKTDLTSIRIAINKISDTIEKMNNAVAKRKDLLSKQDLLDGIDTNLQTRITETKQQLAANATMVTALQSEADKVIHLSRQLHVADIPAPKGFEKDSPLYHEEMERFEGELKSHVQKIVTAINEMDSTGSSKLPNEADYKKEVIEDACNDIQVAHLCLQELYGRLVQDSYPAFAKELEKVKNTATLHPELEHRRDIREYIAAMKLPSFSINVSSQNLKYAGLGILGIAGVGLAVVGVRNCNNDTTAARHGMDAGMTHTDAASDDGRSAIIPPIGARTIGRDAGPDVRDSGIRPNIVAILDAGALRDTSIDVHQDTARDIHVDTGVDVRTDISTAVPDASRPDVTRTETSAPDSAVASHLTTVYRAFSLPGEHTETDQCVRELPQHMCFRIRTTIDTEGEHTVVSPMVLPLELQRENHLDTRVTTDDTAIMSGTTFSFIMNGQQYTCNLSASISNVGPFFTHVPCVPTRR